MGGYVDTRTAVRTIRYSVRSRGGGRSEGRGDVTSPMSGVRLYGRLAGLQGDSREKEIRD
jgi:hypothetical protein